MNFISPAASQSTSASSNYAADRSATVRDTGTITPQSGNSNSTAVATENAQLTVQEAAETLEALNNVMQQMQRGISFQMDENSGRSVIQVIDRDSGDVIKQMPSQDLLKLINHMQEMQSLLFDETV
ncbi:flagellar protein FlaG [Marinobacterium rhizophilum]|uniref:flagellar protein FlaG n=1 Tax=Marinobacterium rhizophilum TaxID=420402 RepID=UPI00037AD5D9|nr:flagellar protein FlaG [Marinobacterium rhizophilum]